MVGPEESRLSYATIDEEAGGRTVKAGRPVKAGRTVKAGRRVLLGGLKIDNKYDEKNHPYARHRYCR